MEPNQTTQLLHGKRGSHWRELATNRIEKSFAVYLSDKGLCKSRIYKEHKQIYKNKTDKAIRNWAKDMNGRFTKEDIYEASKHE